MKIGYAVLAAIIIAVTLTMHSDPAWASVGLCVLVLLRK